MGTKSHKARSKQYLVVLDNIIDTDNTVAPFKRDVRAKEAINLDKNILLSKSILGLINIAQIIFEADGIIAEIIKSAD